MTAHIAPTDLKLLDAEPRVLDLRVGEALEFAEPIDIRKLVRRNAPELGTHGEVFATVAKTSPAGGRPGEEYWLNEPQAMLICMFARTERAAQVRRDIIAVFMAWRRAHAPTPVLPAVDFPSEDAPLSAYLAKLATLRECRLVHGPRAAARLWSALGLPAVVHSAEYEADDGRACLAHLLDVCTIPLVNRTAPTPIREAIEEAIDDGDLARFALRQDGIAVVHDADGEGIVVANHGPELKKNFAGTAWADGKWARALRRIPGAQPSRRAMFHGQQRRGTFVPLKAIMS